MVTQTSTGRETQFNLGAWLTLFFAIIILVSSIAELAYRFTLPTDGWQVDNLGEELGFVYTKNLLGSPSGLQPGDRVIALEGIPADWQTIDPSSTLRDSWRAGVTLDYTVRRDGQEIHIPVTLVHWQFCAIRPRWWAPCLKLFCWRSPFSFFCAGLEIPVRAHSC